jgi:hypothetical protein
LHNPQIASTKAIDEFLTANPITLSDEDIEDITRRKHLDEKRVEEQKRFYEVARKRAAELDVYMEQYVQRGSPLFWYLPLTYSFLLGSGKTSSNAMA